MISRRDLLAGAAGAAVVAAVRQARVPTPVNFAVPAGACDAHVHIVGDPQRFPFWAGRAYTPPPASVDEARSLHTSLGFTRVVLVQPSIYGTDNACMLDAIGRLGPRARGIAVIDETTPDRALDDMARAGVRGVRLNLETGGVPDAALARQRFQAGAARVAGRKWHVQVFTRLELIEAIQDAVAASPAPVVFDHFGRAQGAAGVSQPGFAALVNLVRTGKAYVKISAPYLCSTQAPDYADMDPIAGALVAANPRRVLWGTDWPHVDAAQVPGRRTTDIAPFFQIDDGHVFNLFAKWVPDASVRKTILVDNPAALYAF